MVRRGVITGLLIAVAVIAAYAADINGHWEASMNTPNGDIRVGFNFKVDGAKLTGTVESPNGDIPIEEGKVEGDHISFKTHFNGNEVNHQGSVSGETIQLKVEGPWGESEMTLKRGAEKKSS